MSDTPPPPSDDGKTPWNIPLPAGGPNIDHAPPIGTAPYTAAGGGAAYVLAPRRSFGRKVWALLVGIKDALSLLFLLLFFTVLFAALSYRPNVRVAHSDGALLLKLDGVVTEQLSDPGTLAAISGGPTLKEYRTRDVIHVINQAAQNGNVKAIVLDLSSFLGGGQVSLSDIGDALSKAREAKPVLAYATAYSADAYQLAAHASEIWTDPNGGVMAVGPGGSRLYYKGLLDKLGVTAHIYRVGTFKSAVEPFMRADQSPESKQADLAYANDLWSDYQADVSAARPNSNIGQFTAQMSQVVAAAGGDLALASKNAGLVDQIGNRMAFDQRVAKQVGHANEKRAGDFKAIRYQDFLAANPVKSSGSAIAVVPLVGEIIDGRASPGTAGGATISKYILDAVADDNVKAIVLRVDSPGGSVLASEDIRQALLTAKAKKLPIIVSMANVAASGGYWVSMPADQIIADPATITGSIGVFGILPTFEKTLAKAGITTDGIQTTPLSGQPDFLGGVNDDFNRIMQASVEQIYGRFTGLVAESRKLPQARVNEIAEGRVWSGIQAHRLGLVDKLGGLNDAVIIAADEAGVSNYHTKYFERTPSAFNVALASMFSEPEDGAEQLRMTIFGMAAMERNLLQRQLWSDLNLLLRANAVMASCLECGAYQPAKANMPRQTEPMWWMNLAALLK